MQSKKNLHIRKPKKLSKFLKCAAIYCLLYLLCGVGLLYAQNLPSQQLSLEEAINKALSANRMIKNEQLKLTGLSLKTKEAKLARYAPIRYTGAYTRLSNVPAFEIALPLGPNGELVTRTIAPVILNQFYNQLGTRQTIYAGGRLKNSLLLSQKAEDAAKLDFQKVQAEVVLNTKLAYWNLYKVQQTLEQVKLSEQQVEADLQDLKNLLKRGAATPNDVLRLEIQLSNIRMQAIDVQAGINSAQVFLNNLLQIPLLTQNQLTSKPEMKEDALDPEALITEAQAARSELKAAQSRVEMSEIAIKIAKGAAMPQVSASANAYLSNPNQRIMPIREKFDPTWDAGIGITIDLWNWGTVKNQVAYAQISTEQAKEYALILQEQVALEVTQQYVALQQYQARYKAAQEMLSMVQENQRLVNVRFKQGLALNSDLIDANAQVLNAQVALVAIITDWVISKAKLDRALGKEN